MTLSGPPGQPSPNYNVYDCGQRYYVAGLDMATRLPVHYQGQSATQGPRIDPITAGCTAILKEDSICQIDESNNSRSTECIVVIFSGTFLGLVCVAFLLVAALNYNKRRGNNSAINDHSQLIGNDAQNYGSQYMSGS